jgi:hypothetical protein
MLLNASIFLPKINNIFIDYKADAPEMISTSSIVILACLALLYFSVNFYKISPAFLEAFSIAFILALCSQAAF